MSRLIRHVFHTVIIILAIGFAAQTAAAQTAKPPDPGCKSKSLDPTCVDPEHYKVLYEDSDVRVLRYDDGPGHFVPKHTHSYPYKVYVITTATREFRAVDETTKGNECQKTAPTTKLFANDELMRPPVTHCEYNNSTTAPTHLIIFEYKNQKTTTNVSARRRPNNSSNRARN
jgi:hypothetical protein